MAAVSNKRKDNGTTLTSGDSDAAKRAKAAGTSGAAASSEGKNVSVLASSTTHGGTDAKEATYLKGFGGEFSSEALPEALPKIGSTPQKCAYGLYAEQLSGTSFTTPRAMNQRVWFYRITPSAKHKPFRPLADEGKHLVADFANAVIDPNQIRWKPFALPTAGNIDFVRGLHTVGGSGSAEMKNGFAIHVYACNTSMTDRSFCNSDGDFLIVPQEGKLTIRTEHGYLIVPPRQFAVIQRGIKFSVGVEGVSRGYICEVFNNHYRLPELGPIGTNGLANAKDFEHPTASYENTPGRYFLVQKFMGRLFEAELSSCPYDVVAWHGNYVPYKYDLDKFCTVNTVSYDHLDPSIFTVLTCPTNEVGVACTDFVVFPPRWLVAEETFRPPYYHRNCMTEFMGNICGKYEAKPDGFLPGGASLHSGMIAHGPDAPTFKRASTAPMMPAKLPHDSVAFMFESTYLMKLTPYGSTAARDEDYYKCWEDLENNFDATKK